ncbi:hypothetical protein Hanom_Chr11g00983341 [Helianthus anomalus]
MYNSFRGLAKQHFSGSNTYWFRASSPFRPLIHSALIDSDVAKRPLNTITLLFHYGSKCSNKVIYKVFIH